MSQKEIIGFSINKDQVYIQLPDRIHNNYGICMFLKNKDAVKIMEFKYLCIKLLNQNHIDWFLQGGSKKEDNEWCYFELWGLKDQNLILKLAQQLGEYFQLPLEIN